jgi:uncharacterized protein YjbJ (UPF0337 family)
MNEDTIKGDWKELKGKVKQQWAKLTDDKLGVMRGKRDELVGEIQKAYGVSRDEAKAQVKSFEDLNK